MSRSILVGLCAVVGLCRSLCGIAQEPTKPPYERLLEGDHAEKATDLEKNIEQAEQADQYEMAIGLSEELLALRTNVQGADHWQTVNERWALNGRRKVAALPTKDRAGWREALEGRREARRMNGIGQFAQAQPLCDEYQRWCLQVFGEKHPQTADGYDFAAMNLQAHARYADALSLCQKALELNRELLGEKHPITATSLNYVATVLDDLGRHGEAKLLHQKALHLRLGVLGEKHRLIPQSWNNLAYNLEELGEHKEAQPFLQKALDLRLETIGENHRDTARSYNNLAANLASQGRHVDAEPLYQKALDINVKLLGERHPDTARSFGNMAANLSALGKYAKAQPLLEKALDLTVELRGEKHPATVYGIGNLAVNLYRQRKYAEAQPLHQRALELAREVHGEKHPETITRIHYLGLNFSAQEKHAEAQTLYQRALDLAREVRGNKHPETVDLIVKLASNLNDLGKYAEAEPLCREALDLRRERFGELHVETIHGYALLAVNLMEQAKHPDAQPLFQKALDLRLELHGEAHTATSASYSDLAAILQAQGKYGEAEPLFRKAVDITRTVLGEKSLQTATIYGNLAANLTLQGRYVEAQLLHQKGLELKVELVGEKHHLTAVSYTSLAGVLDAQGKHAEAQSLHQNALKVIIELRGEKHPLTIKCYNNLASNLQSQLKYIEAQALFLKALDIEIGLVGENSRAAATIHGHLGGLLCAQGKFSEAHTHYQKALELHCALLGESHADTAQSHSALAGNLSLRGDFTGAQTHLENALTIYRNAYGERHPDIARASARLAWNLQRQNDYAGAQQPLEKALDLMREVLGENHSSTTTTTRSLAVNLLAQGKHQQALEVLGPAAATYEAARLAVAGGGMDRGVFGEEASPYPLIATTRAQLDMPGDAWVTAETDLARGLSDEAAMRRGATLIGDKPARKTNLVATLNQLQPRILQLITQRSPTASEQDELKELLAQRRMREAELTELAISLSALEFASLAQVQAAIPADAALILWIDVTYRGAVSEHWGCVVRRTGEPHWHRLPGTGPGQTWTKDDTALSGKLRDALVSNTEPPAEIEALALKLYAQRLAPLSRHIDGVRRLYIVAVNQMAGIPLEVLTRDYTISYIPSGTFLARIKDKAPPAGSSVLALADPVFHPAADASRLTDGADETPSGPKPLPPGGLLITMVAPNSAAAAARLQPRDVLLSYASVDLTSIEKLTELIQANAEGDREASAPRLKIPISVWREGEEKPFTRTVPPGWLGITLEKEPALQAITHRRKADEMLFALRRGGDWKELPGTRVELTQLAKLFGHDTTALLDSAASEQSLEEIRKSGDLWKYRYLHFATHGEANTGRAMESVLILSRDKLPETPLPRAGEPFINGQLSANEVLEFWNLNAELVTLSACETALGREGGGDGLLGFAQAFLTAGSRAVCLSLWKVDDSATALLMTRFYQNLLGKRDGLDRPMPKAAALAEAKRWLRELSAEEALELTAAATKGVVRGNRGKDEIALIVPSPDSKESAARDSKPFAHPRYWSAFILIGDPN